MRKLIIIKIGSNALVFPAGTVRRKVIGWIVDEVAHAHALGYRVIIITSGATLAGMRAEAHLVPAGGEVWRKQMAASVGQPTIVQAWIEAFARRGIFAGQVLRTHADFGRGSTAAESIAFLERFARCGGVPIINEDDTRSAEEMKAYINEKGDNDQLACRVARAMKAKRVFLFTDVPGVCEMSPSGKPLGDPIPVIPRVTKAVWSMVRDHASARPTGMSSKLKVADRLQKAGITAHIARPGKEVIMPILRGKQIGTTFPAWKPRRT